MTKNGDLRFTRTETKPMILDRVRILTSCYLATGVKLRATLAAQRINDGSSCGQKKKKKRKKREDTVLASKVCKVPALSGDLMILVVETMERTLKDSCGEFGNADVSSFGLVFGAKVSEWRKRQADME